MAQTKRRGLGRGLSALIPDQPIKPETPSAATAGLVNLPIEEVLPSDSQPRQRFEETALEELRQSIDRHGILQPIVVRRRGSAFEIVAGERRWRAAQKAGLRDSGSGQ